MGYNMKIKINSWSNKTGPFIGILKPSTNKYECTELDTSSGKISIKTEGI